MECFYFKLSFFSVPFYLCYLPSIWHFDNLYYSNSNWHQTQSETPFFFYIILQRNPFLAPTQLLLVHSFKIPCINEPGSIEWDGAQGGQAVHRWNKLRLSRFPHLSKGRWTLLSHLLFLMRGERVGCPNKKNDMTDMDTLTVAGLWEAHNTKHVRFPSFLKYTSLNPKCPREA